MICCRFHTCFYKLLVLLFFLTSAEVLLSQEEHILRGIVFDRTTGIPLTGATVLVPQKGIGSVTDTSGRYQLSLPSGEWQIQVNYLGYHPADTLVSLNSSYSINFPLRSSRLMYDEVRVTADARHDLVNEVQMSEVYLKQKEIASLPALLGEADPLRILQLTPGVQSSTEGGMGFFVRGGSVDQNLVLFDNAVIYNPGHLLGFLSVFNPDIISEVSLSKAGIPARFGGRLSSVVRVNTIRGASDSLRLKGQIGMVSSRIAVNRSFNQARSSFFISARRASIDLMIKPLILPLMKKSSPYFRDSDYNFYDLSAGLTHRLGKKDMISFSSFYGEDDYGLTRSSVRGKIGMNWGNALISGRWTHFFKDSLSLTNSVSHSVYRFDLLGTQSDYAFGIASSISDYTLKSQVSYLLTNHKINTGLELTHHSFVPNEISVNASGLMVDFLEFNKLYAYEGGIFADDEVLLQGPLSFNFGLRYSFFNQVGPYREYLYDDLSQVYDSLLYPAGKSIAFYDQLEPRISIRYQLNDYSSLKASWMRMAQYVHLATSSTVSLPTDIWLPSSATIRPQLGSQWSLGYFRKLFNNRFEASAEVYYKNSRNQLEFIRGVINNSLNMTLDDNLAVGDGQSYGSEFFFRKGQGDFTGWISYTLARAVRQFDKINEGKVYPAKYDRRHDLSLAAMYRVNDFWEFSAVFVYVTGNAFTVPVGRYMIQGNLVNEYGEVNNYRMPAYHRLDLAATRTRITRGGNLSSWNFSVYNAYNRANPFYIYFETSGNLDKYQLTVTPKLVSLFPVIPSVSWKFEF
ncbi:MAG: TonB-dependent receptor [Bacteroidales bacterium]